MASLQKLRYVTERYDELQGLRRVPFGLAFLLLGWLSASGNYSGLASATLPVAVLADPAIGVWYSRTYGRTQPTGRAWGWGLLLLAVIVAPFFFPVAPRTQSALLAAGGLTAFVLTLLIGLRVLGGIRPSDILVCVAFASVGLLGLVGVLSSGPLELYGWIWIAVGLAIAVGGVLDHLLLVRVMASARKEADARLH